MPAALKLDTRFRVSERARNMGGSRMFVELGSEVSVEDLIKGMIVLSGNDACVVIAEGLSGNEDSFAERMTAKARELGMTGTVFKNASGWPAEGQWTTARDLARAVVAHHRGFPEALSLLRRDQLDLQQHQAGQPQPPAARSRRAPTA